MFLKNQYNYCDLLKQESNYYSQIDLHHFQLYDFFFVQKKW